jgi:hypothetical protein
LASADVVHVLATLLEGVDLGEDAVLLEGPLLFLIVSGIFVDDLLEVFEDVEPFVTEVDRVVELLHAELDVTIEHVFDVDVADATLDDLVTDFLEQIADLFVVLIVQASIPYHSHSHKQIWDNLWDLLWRRLVQSNTRIFQILQKRQVTFSLLSLSLNLLSMLVEILSFLNRQLSNRLDVLGIKLLVDVTEVLLPLTPILDDVKRSCILLVLVHLLSVGDVLNLVGPVLK